VKSFLAIYSRTFVVRLTESKKEELGPRDLSRPGLKSLKKLGRKGWGFLSPYLLKCLLIIHVHPEPKPFAEQASPRNMLRKEVKNGCTEKEGSSGGPPWLKKGGGDYEGIVKDKFFQGY